MTENNKSNKIPRIVFYEQQELLEYFSTDNLELLVDILDGIYTGYINKLDDIDIFEIQHEGSLNVLIFNLPKDRWIGQLNELINAFAKLEEYELASETKKLISKIKRRITIENKKTKKS